MRSAAAAALTGTQADVEQFVATGLASAVAEDNRVALFKALAGSGKGVARDISAALTAGDEAITAFLAGGSRRRSWRISASSPSRCWARAARV